MLLLGLAEPDQGSLFMISGFCIGAGGSLTMLNSFPLSFVVENEYIPLIMTSVNCLFDASAVMFLVCYLVYNHFKASRAEIFVTLAVIAAVLYALLSLAWYHCEPELVQQKRLLASSEDESSAEEVPRAEGVELTSTRDRDVSVVSGKSSELLGDCEVAGTLSPVGSGKAPSPSPAPPVDRTYFTPWTSQLLSTKFIFITLFASICILRSNAYFGVVKESLTRLGDEDTGYLYTQLFVACLPLGFLFIPVINYSLVTHGFMTTFRIISVLGVLYGGFVLVPSLESQVVTFLSFTAFRAFLFSVISTYFARMFGPINAGRLYGSMSIAASAFNFLQYPAFLLLGSTMFYYNLILLLLAIPAIVLVERMLQPIITLNPDADVKQAKND
jgi:MFS transporter, LAT3 family, solute carrier family 43, member 3